MITTKQRAKLKGMANRLEPIFQVGKDAVSPAMIDALDAALEKRELIKINVLNNCDEDLHFVADQIASRTHSDVVQVIGHKIIFYRPAKKPIIVL